MQKSSLFAVSPGTEKKERLSAACLAACNYGDCETECQRAITRHELTARGTPLYVPFSPLKRSDEVLPVVNPQANCPNADAIEVDGFKPNPLIKTIAERSIDSNT